MVILVTGQVVAFVHALPITSSTLSLQHIMNALCNVCFIAAAMSTVLANVTQFTDRLTLKNNA